MIDFVREDEKEKRYCFYCGRALMKKKRLLYYCERCDIYFIREGMRLVLL